MLFALLIFFVELCTSTFMCHVSITVGMPLAKFKLYYLLLYVGQCREEKRESRTN
jgi:hypothetical protein